MFFLVACPVLRALAGLLGNLETRSLQDCHCSRISYADISRDRCSTSYASGALFRGRSAPFEDKGQFRWQWGRCFFCVRANFRACNLCRLCVGSLWPGARDRDLLQILSRDLNGDLCKGFTKTLAETFSHDLMQSAQVTF